MTIISNLRKSIFYIQETLREPEYTKNKKVLKALNLLVEVYNQENTIEYYVRCTDKFDREIQEGDTVDVQNVGQHKVYKKEDGQLYFKPYSREERVSHYFSNDIEKVR